MITGIQTRRSNVEAQAAYLVQTRKCLGAHILHVRLAGKVPGLALGVASPDNGALLKTLGRRTRASASQRRLGATDGTLGDCLAAIVDTKGAVGSSVVEQHVVQDLTVADCFELGHAGERLGHDLVCVHGSIVVIGVALARTCSKLACLELLGGGRMAAFADELGSVSIVRAFSRAWRDVAIAIKVEHESR